MAHIHTTTKMWFNSFSLQHWSVDQCSLTHSLPFTQLDGLYHIYTIIMRLHISTNYDQSLNVCEQCAIRFFMYISTSVTPIITQPQLNSANNIQYMQHHVIIFMEKKVCMVCR